MRAAIVRLEVEEACTEECLPNVRDVISPLIVKCPW
jgi:hypothetical protein